jgi:hypothetical protein
MNKIINQLYDVLAQILVYISKFAGMSYKHMNILVFCVIEPVIFLAMLYIIIKQYYKIKSLKPIIWEK